MERIYKQLTKNIASGDFAHAHIFVDANDSARNTLLGQIARSLLCEKEQGIGTHCGTCRFCLAGKEHLEHVVISIATEKDKTKIGIDSIHKALLRVQLGNGENWNVVLLEDLSLMTREAAAALLKTLEEPPARTKFILGARSTEDILPTIRSRAVVMHVDATVLEESVPTPKTLEDALVLRDNLTKDRAGAIKFLGGLIKDVEGRIVDGDANNERILFCLKELSAARQDIDQTSCNVGLALDRALFAADGILFTNES